MISIVSSPLWPGLLREDGLPQPDPIAMPWSFMMQPMEHLLLPTISIQTIPTRSPDPRMENFSLQAAVVVQEQQYRYGIPPTTAELHITLAIPVQSIL